MKRQAMTSIAALMILAAAFVFAQPATAAPQPSSDLLLPYFEVDLDGGLTTLFAVVNSHEEEAVPARISVFSNWGIEVLTEEILLQPEEVKTINLADWIRSGNVPSKKLRGEDLDHLQATLTGQESQKNGMYYSSNIRPNLAVGFVEIRVTGTPRHDVLWGDYFTVDPLQDFAQGEILVNIDRTAECGSLCARRALRFLTGGGFDGGTEIILWTGRRGVPTANGYFNPGNAVETQAAVYDERGQHIDERLMSLRPVEIVTVAELGLSEPFGWLNLEADTEFFMAVRYSANNRFSVGLVSHCLPVRVTTPPPSDPPCTGSECDPEPPVCTGSECDPEPPVCTENCDPEPPCTENCDPEPPCTENCDPEPPCTENCNPEPPCTENCDPEPPVECGACEGKITTLTLQYLGDTAAHVEVIAKRGGNGDDTVYNGTLNPGDTFTVVGPASGNGGFAGTLGTEIRFYIDGSYQTFLHTSCSAPVGPGTIAGSFLVLEGASKEGGNLCPM